MALEIATLSDGQATISDEQLEELGMGFRGEVITPTDQRYDEVRAVQNLHIDGKPGLIVRCTGTADVIDAVNLAREQELLVAVRGGGHHVGGHGTTQGGLLIDLSPMSGVWIDAGNRTAYVQGGATWGDVDREAQAFGLAVPGGVVSTTGVGGLTLGGGIGWLHRKWGLSCDSLRAVEIVTADGRLVTASAEENPELFWGLRGGGGNFGVAVNFVFEAYPLGPIVEPAAVFYPPEQASEILRSWRDWASGTPDEVTTRALFWTMPADPSLPPEVHDKEVLIIGALYAGDQDEGAKVLQPAREFAEPLADISQPMPYRFFQAAFDELSTGLHSYWKSTYFDELSDEAIDFIAERGCSRPVPRTLVHVPIMGGATARVGAADSAFGDRSAPWMLSVDGNWTDPKDADKVIDWVRESIAQAQNLPGAGGAYLNFTGDESTDASVVQAQFGQNLERLAGLKKKYDPDNLFRLNNNIQPA